MLADEENGRSRGELRRSFKAVQEHSFYFYPRSNRARLRDASIVRLYFNLPSVVSANCRIYLFSWLFIAHGSDRYYELTVNLETRPSRALSLNNREGNPRGDYNTLQ